MLETKTTKPTQEGRVICNTPIHSLDNEPVILKGFLYQTQDGKWLLSQTPNAKHCCIQNLEQETSSIYVAIKEDFTNSFSGQAVTLKGVLKPYFNTYILEKPTFEHSKKHLPFFSLSWLLLGIVIILFILIKRKKSSI